MVSTSETGHAKNVANFQQLINLIIQLGTTYKPSKNSLQLPQLITLKTTAENNISEVLHAKINHSNKINERLMAFNGIKVLTTRLINALQATDASDEKIANAKTYNRKIQGKRALSSKKTTTPDGTPTKTISTSQQSYDLLIHHLNGLNQTLKTEPSYHPNETDLQFETIQEKIKTLNEKNNEVIGAYVKASRARMERDKTLYSENTGLIETANDVKKYLKSVFGTNSPEYEQVKGILFKKPKM